MYVSGVRLRNYSSFEDSGQIELSPGINLFVGPNNCGKSALLRSIVSPMPNNPHRGSGDLPIQPPPSSVELQITITIGDLYERLQRSGLQPVFPMGGTEGQNELSRLLSSPSNIVTVEAIRQAGTGVGPLGGASISSLRNPANQRVMQVGRTADGKFSFQGKPGGLDNLTHFLDHPASGSAFYFGSQRVNVGRVSISDEFALKPDASNLPTVLAHVQNTRAPIFELIEEHLSEILPGVQRITVPPRGGEFKILLWPQRRGPQSDLSFSLDESGSGVGQLLALICAIVLHSQAIIVVDEINTYLHPAAIKKLFRLIQAQYPQHQYIISAHSADVIFGSNPTKLFTVRRDDLVSEVNELQLQTAEDARRIAGLLGFSMLDVFGNDRIIWVEGPTEEVVFPLVLEAFGKPLRPEIGVCSVGNPASFSVSTTRRDEILGIYENAGKRLAPLLQGMAFGLDRERLSDDAVAKLESSKRKLRFLPRRCLENYFMMPAAIARVLANLGETVTADDVEAQLVALGGDPAYSAHRYWNGDLNAAAWLRWVDAPKLLAQLFRNLTDARQEFRKTRDTVSLARAVLGTDKESLSELFRFIANLVVIAERDTKP